MRTRVCSSGGDSLTSSERKLSRTAALPRMLICLVAVKIRSLSAPQVGQVLASGREVGGSSQSPLCTACIHTPCHYQLPRTCVLSRLATGVGVEKAWRQDYQRDNSLQTRIAAFEVTANVLSPTMHRALALVAQALSSFCRPSSEACFLTGLRTVLSQSRPVWLNHTLPYWQLNQKHCARP